MATRTANVKGIKFLEENQGGTNGGVALITFDLLNTVYTGGADTITLGGAGFDAGVATTSTLAVLMQNRRRDGKTVVITGICAGGAVSGSQAAATNGPTFFVQTAATSAGNVTAITLLNAATGGSAVSTTVATWDRPAAIAVTYTAT